MERFGFLTAIFYLSTPLLVAHESHHQSRLYSDDCWVHDHHSRQSAGRRSGCPSYENPAADLRVFEGRIAGIIYRPGISRSSALVDIRLQSGERTLVARLAPADVLRRGGMQLKEGESISILGFAVAGLDGDIIIAVELSQGERVLKLRDSRGDSIW